MSDSDMARDSFRTFIPLSVENEARTSIIFDFFDLLAAVAAHSKMNGLGGRKLSRMVSWWAFEHKDTGNGFGNDHRSGPTIPALFWNAPGYMCVLKLRVIQCTGARGLCTIEARDGGFVCNAAGANGAVGEEAGNKIVCTHDYASGR